MDTSDEGTTLEDSFLYEHIFSIYTHTPWYVDISNFLATGEVPQHLYHREQWRIIHHNARYSWIDEYLFYIGFDEKIQHCISGNDIYDILKVSHDGPCGGHFADKRTCYKVLQIGYYWPSIFHDARNMLEGVIVSSRWVGLVEHMNCRYSPN